MENWIQDAILKWKSEGVKLNPPATIAEIEKAEVVLDFNFPDDFKQLYLVVNGFEDWDMQEHNFSFWPLDRIMEQHGEGNNKSFIGFSDWAILCNVIGFVKESAGVYKDYLTYIDSRPSQSGVIVSVKDAYGTKEYLRVIDKIAENFREVVVMINTGTGNIY